MGISLVANLTGHGLRALPRNTRRPQFTNRPNSKAVSKLKEVRLWAIETLFLPPAMVRVYETGKAGKISASLKGKACTIA